VTASSVIEQCGQIVCTQSILCTREFDEQVLCGYSLHIIVSSDAVELYWKRNQHRKPVWVGLYGCCLWSCP